jgi:DNA-binding response OmpR family regulator
MVRTKRWKSWVRREGVWIWCCWTVMPGGDGVALTNSIREEWPDQRLLYMSAHPAEILARHGLQDLQVPFLAKPYSRAELLAQVKGALRRRATGQGVSDTSVVERRRAPRLKGR